MNREYLKFALGFFIILVLDQVIKFLFLNGFVYHGEFFSLILTYNRGVAFSMFAFLDDNLKFVQLLLIALLFAYLFYQREFFRENSVAFGFLLGAGCSNLLDRFMHGGVVDYVFWHKWFEFAVFNFADVMINIAVLLILLQSLFFDKKKEKI